MQLPHRTGSPLHDFLLDEIVILTRATLVGISDSCIGLVVEALVQLLEELAAPYAGVHTHPAHVLHSEIFVLELLAECCSTHWASVNPSPATVSSSGQSSSHEASDLERGSKDPPSPDVSQSQRRRASRNRLLERGMPPEPLTDDIVRRMINAITLFSSPISDNHVLPAANILDDVSSRAASGTVPTPGDTVPANGYGNSSDVASLLLDEADTIELFTRDVIEYVSFSNWPCVFGHLKNTLQQAIRQPAPLPVQNTTLVDDDRNPLTSLRLVSSFWVDGHKLSIIIQELCGSFLHLRKPFQITLAIVLPMLITRWLERNPEEFIDLHTMHKRLDGGAETLFDMTNTMFEGGKRKALLFPLQTSLLLLLPEVFEYASNMRDVKSSSSISKKVFFLELLRKALRNRNETAIYCLTSVLRVARHFPLDSDAAILSYALDVQEEVREAVFRRYNPGVDTTNIDSALLNAAFVSLAHLNFEHCVENLTPACLATSAPQHFKIAVISACSHFARQTNADEYQPLFAKVADFVRTQLRVFHQWPLV